MIVFSQKGFQHPKSQDYTNAFVDCQTAIVCLADGASTCSKGAEGAKDVCHSIIETIMCSPALFASPQTSKTMLTFHIMNEVTASLERKANKGSKEIRDYSSTLCFAAFFKDSKRLFLFSLGNSMIILKTKSNLIFPFEPQTVQEETVMTTTKNAQPQILCIDSRPIEEVVLMSDGAWNVVGREIEEFCDNTSFSKVIKQKLQEDQKPKDDLTLISINLREAESV